MTDLLTRFLTGQGHDPAIIAKALDKLDKAAALGGGTALYDANLEVYGLLRYGAKVRPGLGEPAMRHLLDTSIRAEGSEGGRRSLVPLGCLHGASPLSATRFVSAPVAQPG